MTVAELFVNIGITGNNKVAKALDGVHQGLQKTADLSLGAKAAILGTLFGFEEMTRSAANTGTGLLQFANATDMSTSSLQKWRYWAKLNGVAAEDLDSTVIHLSDAVARAARGEQFKGSTFLAGINPLQDPIKIFEDVRKKMQGLHGPAQVNFMRSLLNDLGFSNPMVAMMRGGVFPQVPKQAILSGKEIGGLAGIGREWEKLFALFGGEKNKMVAKFAGPITEAIEEIGDAFQMAAEGIHSFIDYMTKLIDRIPNIGTALKASLPILSGIAGAMLPWVGGPVTGIAAGIATAGVPIGSRMWRHRNDVDPATGKKISMIDDFKSALTNKYGMEKDKEVPRSETTNHTHIEINGDVLNDKMVKAIDDHVRSAYAQANALNQKRMSP